MGDKTLEDYQDEMEKRRRMFVQARAILQRGKRAGIPDKYLRVKQDEFRDLLCDKYHKDVNKFAETVYKNPKVLFKKPFVIIDGGSLHDSHARKKAAFAILFRMIACDKHGNTYNCSNLAGQFQTLKGAGFENRNDLVKKVKEEQILFLSEFYHKRFSMYLTDAGVFFDQLLEYRDDYSKPTIITFTVPLAGQLTNQENAIKEDHCGSYLAMLSHADIRNDENVFRVRVK